LEVVPSFDLTSFINSSVDFEFFFHYRTKTLASLCKDTSELHE
jgi:hypothetical protein